MQKMVIAPSILSADLANLGKEVELVLNCGADWIHFDVMDNHYVPNLTFGPMVCKSLREFGITAPIDVHLMIEPVDRIIPDFAKAGATYITIHPESTKHVDRSLQLIKENGCKAGLAFNPSTTLDIIEYVADKLDMILIMTVNPGFAGQKFISSGLKKIEQARKIIENLNKTIRLEVDGGIGIDNIVDVVASGADTIVSGSAIFGSKDYKATIQAMRQNIKAIKK